MRNERFLAVAVALAVGVSVTSIMQVTASVATTASIVGTIVLFTIWWAWRDSVVFNLVAVILPFAVLDWSEVLLTQFQLGAAALNIVDVAIIGFLLIQVGAAFQSREWKFAGTEWVILLVLIAISLVIGIARGNRSYDVLRAVRVTGYLVGAFLGTSRLLRSPTDVRQGLKVLAVMGCVSALTLWRVGIAGIGRSSSFVNLRSFSVASILDVVNVTAQLYLATFVILLCYLVSNRSRRHSFWLIVPALVLMVGSVAFSGIRTNWGAAVAVSIYIIFRSTERRSTFKVAAVLVVILLGVFGGSIVASRLINQATGLQADQVLAERLDMNDSAEGRLEDTVQAIAAVNRQGGWIFGNGLGASTGYRPAFLSPTDDWTAVHNSYAWYYLNLGFAGLATLVYIIVRLLSNTARAYTRSRYTDWGWRVLALHAIVLLLAVQAFSAATMSIMPGSIVATGICYALAIRTADFADVHRRGVSVRRPCLAGPRVPLARISA
jgi:hypothetical protein